MKNFYEEITTLLVLAVLTSSSASREVPQNVKIFGGDTAKPNQFPFAVSLQMLDGTVHWCGASIINKNWILTAAQCLAYVEAEDVTVLAGTTTLNATGVTFNIDTIIVHPDYSYQTMQDDIALAKIVGEFTFSDSVQAIGIGETSAGTSATVIGWGASEDEDSTNELHFADVSVLTEEECSNQSKDGTYVFDRGDGQLCALASGGTAPCHGDSGGPLISNGTLVGIVSYGVTPCAKGYPDVYTKVSYYSDWIENNINEKTLFYWK